MKKVKDLKQKSRQDEMKKDTEKRKVKKDQKEKKDTSFLDSKEEPTTKDRGRSQSSKISLNETKMSTAGIVSGCMLDENGVQSPNKYSQLFEKTTV